MGDADVVDLGGDTGAGRSTDSEKVKLGKEKFIKGSAKLASKVGWIQAFIVLLLYLLVSSDVFTMHVLKYIPGSMDGYSLTGWGYLYAGLILAIMFLIIDLLLKGAGIV